MSNFYKLEQNVLPYTTDFDIILAEKLDIVPLTAFKDLDGNIITPETKDWVISYFNPTLHPELLSVPNLGAFLGVISLQICQALPQFSEIAFTEISNTTGYIESFKSVAEYSYETVAELIKQNKFSIAKSGKLLSLSALEDIFDTTSPVDTTKDYLFLVFPIDTFGNVTDLILHSWTCIRGL